MATTEVFPADAEGVFCQYMTCKLLLDFGARYQDASLRSQKGFCFHITSLQRKLIEQGHEIKWAGPAAQHCAYQLLWNSAYHAAI